MPKHLRYAGKTYEIEPWGGAHSVDQSPTISPVHKKLRRADTDKEIVHRRFTNTMDEDTNMEGNEPAAAKGKGSAHPHQGKHETKVIKQQPQYGLPQVQTVTLPFTMYFCAITQDANNNTIPTQFRIKMTSLANLFPFSLDDPSSAGSAYVPGLYNRVGSEGTTWSNPLRSFPQNTSSGTHTTERPAWLTFWAKIYQAYTVTKCEWEMTLHNPRASNQAEVIIGYGEEAEGVNSGVNFPQTGLAQAENFPDMTFKMLHSNNDGSTRDKYCNIAGTYYPGQVKEHVSNDEDVQTWVKYEDPTALPAPALTEQMRFYLWKAPFNSDPNPQPINIRLHLRITAQFRDIREAFRYPAGQTAISLTAPTDVYHVA